MIKVFSWILCIIHLRGDSNSNLLWTEQSKQDGFLKSLRQSKLYVKSWWSSWAIFFSSNYVSVCCAHYMHTLAHACAPKGLTFCMQCTLQFWGATDATSSWAQTKSWSEQRWYKRRAACHILPQLTWSNHHPQTSSSLFLPLSFSLTLYYRSYLSSTWKEMLLWRSHRV